MYGITGEQMIYVRNYSLNTTERRMIYVRNYSLNTTEGGGFM